VDTKVSNLIKVSNTGDFIFSRRADELSHSQKYGYVLAGTMVKEARGVLIQSRIINIRNKQLLTTASKFIPSLVTSSIGE
jgi:TolB-like protein